jgi:hypothetical protein
VIPTPTGGSSRLASGIEFHPLYVTAENAGGISHQKGKLFSECKFTTRGCSGCLERLTAIWEEIVHTASASDALATNLVAKELPSQVTKLLQGWRTQRLRRVAPLGLATH